MTAFVQRPSRNPGLWQKENGISSLVLLSSAALLYGWFSYQLFRTVGHVPLGADAWSLIEVARSIQNGTFPEIETVRQFKLVDYVFSNTAFPPLTPMLLALHGSEGAWASAIVCQSILIALVLPAPIFFPLKRKFSPLEAISIALLTVVAALSYAHIAKTL